MSRAFPRRSAPIVALAALVGACNAAFGVDDLSFDAAAASSGAGPTTTTSSSGSGGASGTSSSAMGGTASSTGGAMPCEPGTTMSCYDGPAGTEGIGACVAGTATCSAEGDGYGPCEGQVVPAAACNASADTNCTGTLCGETTTAATFGVGSPQGATDVAIAPNGDVVVVGYYRNTIDFGDGNLPSAGSNQLGFVARFTAAGTLLWSRELGNLGKVEPHAVAVDSQDRIVIGADLGGTAVVAGQTFIGVDQSCLVVQLDGDGNDLWGKNFSNGSDCLIRSIGVDAAGGILASAAVNSSVDFGTGTVGGGGDYDACAFKLDASGDTQWADCYGAAQLQIGRSAVLSNGDMLLAGYFSGTITFDVAHTNSVFIIRDIFAARLDGTTGTPTWSAAFTGAQTNVLLAVAALPNEGFALGGYFEGDLTIGPETLSATNESGFVAAFDGSGNVDWALAVDGAQDDRVTGLAASPNGDVVLAGSYDTDLSIASMSPPTFAAGSHLVVARLDSGGTPLFVNGYEVPGGGDLADFFWDGWRSVAVGPDGTMHVVGHFDDSIGITQPPTSASNDDVFLLTLAP